MSFNEWEKVKLSEISVGNKGNYGIGASAVDYDENLYTYLRITDITDDGRLNKEGLKSVDDKDAKNYLLSENDIVFARTGNSTGRSYFYEPSDGELVYAGFLIKFKLDESKVNPRYIKLYTMTNEYKNWIESISTGSTRKNINAKMYGDMDISIPSREEQDYIVNLIEPLNNKIEVNNKINKRLEDMAQAIFKQWFVDFEFPNEEGKPYKSSGGEMVESELGMIPKGWEVMSIDQICNVTIGKTPPRKESQWFSENNEDIKWISIKDLGNCGTYIFNTSEYLTNDAVEKFNVKRVPKDTVILSFKLTVGRIAITTSEMLTNEAIAHFDITDKKLLSTEYLYSYLKNFNYETLGSTSSIATAVNSKIIKKIPILVSNANILEAFSKYINNIFRLIRNNELEVINLQNTRDAILPKLMSGEIRVPLDK